MLLIDFHKHPIVLFCLRSYLSPGHFVLYDCGLGYGSHYDVFKAPSSGFKRRPANLLTLCQDHMMRSKRTAVERSYGRLKSKFPVIENWKGRKENLDPVFYDAVALKNIDLKENPLTADCCDGFNFGVNKDQCPLCVAVDPKRYNVSLQTGDLPDSGYL